MATDNRNASMNLWDQRAVSPEATRPVRSVTHRHLALVVSNVPPAPRYVPPAPRSAPRLRQDAIDSSTLVAIPPPPASSRRRITPLRPIILPEGRGRMPSNPNLSLQLQGPGMQAPASIKEILMPMAAALLCGGLFWLLAAVKTIPW
jgi:hypothetical protein